MVSVPVHPLGQRMIGNAKAQINASASWSNAERVRYRCVGIVQSVFRTAWPSAHELPVDARVNENAPTLWIDFEARAAGSHPFTLVKTMPCMKYFCAKKKISSTGSVATRKGAVTGSPAPRPAAASTVTDAQAT